MSEDLKTQVAKAIALNLGHYGNAYGNAAEAVLAIPQIAEALEDAWRALLADPPLDSDV